MLDILIQHGLIIDGSGITGFVGDVGIKNGRIAVINPPHPTPAARVINAEGLIVTPGFIDVHRHADAAVFRPGFGEIELRQGITTIINGNCGLSIAPCSAARRGKILPYLQPVTGTLPPDAPPFENFSSYINTLKHRPLPLNIGSHIGNGTLRMAAMGFTSNKPSPNQIKDIQGFLLDALNAGAFGVSLGLIYAPECYYHPSDMIKVLQPISGTGIPLVTHLRGEGDTLLDSLEEAVTIAKTLHVPLHISHFKCVGRNNWHHMREKAFAYINSADIPITCDVYPWEAGATQLAQILPPQFLEGGMAQVIKRLQDPATRRQCRTAMETTQQGFENLVALIGWENIVISAAPHSPASVGKSIAAIAASQYTNPFDCAFDLLIQNNGNVSIINFIANRDDIDAILRRSDSCVISDALYADSGRSHPRVHGTFPLLFEEYVHNRKVLSLEEAIHKCTGKPADIFNIKQKGLIHQGYDADFVLFDASAIRNHATYTQPTNPPTGITHVIVNGTIAAENNILTHQQTGNIIVRTP
jgi:N-acyl-D-aspartate/D-glutamate deacylase